MTLTGKTIFLRALEPIDIEVLYQWENNTENWQVSNTISPFSRFVLEQYIASSHQDIYTNKQLRLMICLKTDTSITSETKTIGTIDLFDFDANNKRAGIGILIGETSERKKGFASEALQLLIDYCFDTLNLHQVY